MSDEKSKDKRLEEKEKWDAETERSLAVARSKKAHKEIEDAEKERKRPAILSICKRIDLSLGDMKILLNVYIESKSHTWDMVTQTTLIQLRRHQENYDSIRADLQKSLEIKDEDMKKLFPEKEIDKTNFGCAVTSLSNMMVQLRHMKSYCERMLL